MVESEVLSMDVILPQKQIGMRKIAVIGMILCAVSAFSQSEIPDSINAKDLNEVIVKGEKPQISAHDGAISVDLPAIVRDKPVTNILEALSYLPGVVSDNGMIGLNGASSVTIILNGELTNMPLQNLYQLLYSTPVDRLKNVEIMYSAPAKYHVSGAVINIVLKTPRPIDGLMGQTQLGYNQAYYPSYSAGFAATYATKEWTFDANWTLSRNKNRSRQETYSNHLVGGKRTMIEDDMSQISSGLSNLIHAAASFKTLKVTYNGQFKTNANSKSLSCGTFGRYINRHTFNSPIRYNNIAARYDLPRGFTVGGDFTSYFEEKDQTLGKDNSVLINANNRQAIHRYHAYVDKVHQFGSWQLNYGIRYQYSRDYSTQNYIIPENDGFNSVLKENVADAYIGTQASLSCGLSFNASAEAEYFHNDYRHTWNFVPQLGATYYRTPKSVFQLNFTSQRIYPQYWELHGGTSYINDYSTIKGNPALQPYMNYSGQFSYIFSQKYVATLYVLYADKYSVQLPYQKPDELKLLFQTINIDFSRTVGLQFNVPFNVRNIWNATAVANIMAKREKASKFHDIAFDNRRLGFYSSLNNTVKFTPDCPVSLSVDFAYITGQIQGPGTFKSLWKMDAGAKWLFGKKRCCELDFKFTDVFNTWNPKLTIDSSGQDYRMLIHNMNQSMTLSFVWRFNGFKPKQNSVDTSRFGTGN